ncbi:MAG: tetratricopeptide repeat protein [Polyangia bacterium]
MRRAFAILVALALAGCGCDAIERYQQRSEAAELVEEAWLDLELERWEEALDKLTRARELYSRAGDDDGLARALAGMGAAADGMREFDKALDWLRRARDVYLKQHDPDSPWLGTLHTRLGKVLYDMERHGECETALTEAIRIFENAYGEQHMSLVEPLALLATCRWTRGEIEKALAPAERAEKIVDSRPSPPPLATILTRMTVGHALVELGRLDEAEKRFDAALELAGRRLAGTHRIAANLHNEIGYVQLYRGEAKKALEHFERGLSIAEELAGDKSALAATLKDSAGEATCALGDCEKALEMHREALELMRAKRPESRGSIAWVIDNIGVAELRLGRRADAQERFDEAAEALERIHGASHPLLARVLRHRAETELAAGEEERACETLHRALRIYRRELPEGHFRIEQTRAALGRCD